MPEPVDSWRRRRPLARRLGPQDETANRENQGPHTLVQFQFIPVPGEVSTETLLFQFTPGAFSAPTPQNRCKGGSHLLLTMRQAGAGRTNSDSTDPRPRVMVKQSAFPFGAANRRATGPSPIDARERPVVRVCAAPRPG